MYKKSFVRTLVEVATGAYMAMVLVSFMMPLSFNNSVEAVSYCVNSCINKPLQTGISLSSNPQEWVQFLKQAGVVVLPVFVLAYLLFPSKRLFPEVDRAAHAEQDMDGIRALLKAYGYEGYFPPKLTF